MREIIGEGCVLGSRDVRIFEALDLFRVLSLEQIWALFFNEGLTPELWEYLLLERHGRTDGSLSAAYQRMRKLEQFGYLDSQYQWGFHRVYRMNWAGFRHLMAIGKTDFKRPPPWPRKGEMEHSLLLSAIGVALKWLRGIDASSERQLLSWRRLAMLREGKTANSLPLPDMLIQQAETRYLFELELSAKSRQQYIERWKEYNNSIYSLYEDTPRILYVTKGESLHRMILRVAENEHMRGVYSTELNDFRRDASGIWQRSGIVWTNYEERRYNLHMNPALTMVRPIILAAKEEEAVLN